MSKFSKKHHIGGSITIQGSNFLRGQYSEGQLLCLWNSELKLTHTETMSNVYATIYGLVKFLPFDVVINMELRYSCIMEARTFYFTKSLISNY